MSGLTERRAAYERGRTFDTAEALIKALESGNATLTGIARRLLDGWLPCWRETGTTDGDIISHGYWHLTIDRPEIFKDLSEPMSDAEAEMLKRIQEPTP